MAYKRVEEAFDIVKPIMKEMGLTDEKILNLITFVFSPTAEEIGEILKIKLDKLKHK